jgi:hypothetical protein
MCNQCQPIPSVTPLDSRRHIAEDEQEMSRLYTGESVIISRISSGSSRLPFDLRRRMHKIATVLAVINDSLTIEFTEAWAREFIHHLSPGSGWMRRCFKDFSRFRNHWGDADVINNHAGNRIRSLYIYCKVFAIQMVRHFVFAVTDFCRCENGLN